MSEIKDKYWRLKNAADKWSIAADEQRVAGPSYWNGLNTACRIAISRNSCDVAMSDEEIVRNAPDPDVGDALRQAYDKFERQIWLEASKILDAKAVRLRDQLLQEAAETLALAQSLGDEAR